MQFQLERTEGINVISGYDDRGITIGDQRFTQSLVISSNRLTAEWPVTGMDKLDESAFEPVLQHEPEIVLLGSGASHIGADPRWLVWFSNRNIGLEVMDSRAACRTYNILVSEGRSVAAAIILA